MVGWLCGVPHIRETIPFPRMMERLEPVARLIGDRRDEDRMDEIEIAPLKRPIDATVRVPGSKSITNRALILAAMAAGRSTIESALFSDDTRYMIEALRALGFRIESDETQAPYRGRRTRGRNPGFERRPVRRQRRHRDALHPGLPHARARAIQARRERADARAADRRATRRAGESRRASSKRAWQSMPAGSDRAAARLRGRRGRDRRGSLLAIRLRAADAGAAVEEGPAAESDRRSRAALHRHDARDHAALRAPPAASKATRSSFPAASAIRHATSRSSPTLRARATSPPRRRYAVAWCESRTCGPIRFRATSVS